MNVTRACGDGLPFSKRCSSVGGAPQALGSKRRFLRARTELVAKSMNMIPKPIQKRCLLYRGEYFPNHFNPDATIPFFRRQVA